jgi:hypothetical protein
MHRLQRMQSGRNERAQRVCEGHLDDLGWVVARMTVAERPRPS